MGSRLHSPHAASSGKLFGACVPRVCKQHSPLPLPSCLSPLQVGSLHPSGDELMRAVTGSALDPEIFLGYIKKKYSELYKL